MYVYLVKSQRRLVITKKDYSDNDYLMLTNFESYNESLMMVSAKSFCCGYIMANNVEIDVINDIEEFKL